MYKKQMLFQKIVCYALLAAAALVFIYSLGLVTDLHYNNFAYYAEDPENPIFEGAEIYNEIQPFNKQLTTAGILLVISALLTFVFGTHKRRKYYVGNYLTIAINAALGVAVSVWGIVNVIKYKAMYYEIDFEALAMWQKLLGQTTEISTFWFDAGFFVFGAVIAISLLGIANLGFKIFVMRGERKLLEEVL